MNPTVVAKLLSDIPECKEFIAFIQSEVQRLNTLEDFEKVKTEDMTIEVLARLRAVNQLKAILFPLLNSEEKVIGVDSKEFVV